MLQVISIASKSNWNQRVTSRIPTPLNNDRMIAELLNVICTEKYENSNHQGSIKVKKKLGTEQK